LTEQRILPSTEGNNPRFFYGYIIVLAGFIFLVIQHAALYSFGVFLKPVAEEFGWTRAVTSGAYSMCMFIEALLLPVMGRLTDKIGPRVVMTLSGLLSGLGYLLMSQVGAVWQLYLFLGVIVGIGRSGMFVPPTSTVARWFTKRRALMTGIVVSGVGIGTVIGPPIASQFILNYGWRTSYLITGAIALSLLLLSAQFLKRDPSKTGQLPYGETEGKKQNLTFEIGGFSFREAIRTRQFQMLCAMYLCFGYITHSIMVHVVPHATDLGITPIIAASIMAVIGALSTASRIALGSVADRVGNKPVLIIGATLVAASLLCLTLARDLQILYLFAVIFGFGYGGEVVLISPISIPYVHKKLYIRHSTLVPMYT